MSRVNRHCRAAAGAVPVAVALGTAPDASHAQYTPGVKAQHRSVELRRRGVERAMAHAQMPSTIYASTPDPAPPPRAVPVVDCTYIVPRGAVSTPSVGVRAVGVRARTSPHWRHQDARQSSDSCARCPRSFVTLYERPAVATAAQRPRCEPSAMAVRLARVGPEETLSSSSLPVCLVRREQC